MDSAIYLINSGPMLECAKMHVANMKAAKERAYALAKEAGAQRMRLDSDTQVITALMFDGKPPKGFNAPGRHGSTPRKGSVWAKRFAEQEPIESASDAVTRVLNIPHQMNVTLPHDGERYVPLGNFLNPCGILYCSEEGPYAMWIPDIEAERQAYEQRGGCVKEPVRSFSMQIEGCKRITRKQWNIIVNQHESAVREAATASFRYLDHKAIRTNLMAQENPLDLEQLRALAVFAGAKKIESYQNPSWDDGDYGFLADFGRGLRDFYPHISLGHAIELASLLNINISLNVKGAHAQASAAQSRPLEHFEQNESPSGEPAHAVCRAVTRLALQLLEQSKQNERPSLHANHQSEN